MGGVERTIGGDGVSIEDECLEVGKDVESVQTLEETGGVEDCTFYTEEDRERDL